MRSSLFKIGITCFSLLLLADCKKKEQDNQPRIPGSLAKYTHQMCKSYDCRHILRGYGVMDTTYQFNDTTIGISYLNDNSVMFGGITLSFSQSDDSVLVYTYTTDYRYNSDKLNYFYKKDSICLEMTRRLSNAGYTEEHYYSK